MECENGETGMWAHHWAQCATTLSLGIPGTREANVPSLCYAGASNFPTPPPPRQPRNRSYKSRDSVGGHEVCMLHQVRTMIENPRKKNMHCGSREPTLRAQFLQGIQPLIALQPPFCGHGAPLFNIRRPICYSTENKCLSPFQVPPAFSSTP